MHPTYRHLERSARLAGLTWRQWTCLCASALAAYLTARIAPLPAPYNLSVALTVCGAPVAATLALGGADRQLTITPRVVWEWRRRAGVYLPG